MTENKPKNPSAVPGEMHRIDQDRNAGENLKRRDAELYVVLGLFMVALGIPVIIGTYFAAQVADYRPAVVNFVCGMTLTGIGIASIYYGRVLRRKLA